MADDKKNAFSRTRALSQRFRRFCDALVAEAYGKQATQGRRGVATMEPKKSSSIRSDGAAQKSSIEASVVSARRGPAAIREQAQPSSRQRQQRKRARLGHDRDRE